MWNNHITKVLPCINAQQTAAKIISKGQQTLFSNSLNQSGLKAALNNYTIKHQISLGTSLLEKVSDSAKLDTQILLSFILNKEINYLYTWPENQLDPQQLTNFEALLQQRLQGKPIAYITGSKEFWSLPFKCNSSTLIPRPDTEILVEQVLEEAEQNLKLPIKCLDLGTGTGAIALALASEQPNWQIDAIDYSDDAVELAQHNAKALSLEHVNMYQSDWFTNVDTATGFDIIISNPPYIDENDIHLSQGDVQFEPLSALVADNAGFADIEKIAKDALEYLNTGGYIFFEHGFEQGEGVRAILKVLSYQSIQTIKDLNENDRVTFARKS